MPNKYYTVGHFSNHPTHPHSVQQSPEFSEVWRPAVSRGLDAGMWRIRKQVSVLSEGKTDYYCSLRLDWEPIDSGVVFMVDILVATDQF